MRSSLTTSISPFSVAETANKLEALLKKLSIRIFARIDHGEAARVSELELRDEEVVIFGDPKVGTYLMQECPDIGIELPLKMLIWSEHEKTNIGYKDPEMLLTEYEISKHTEIIKKMSGLMARLVKETIEQQN